MVREQSKIEREKKRKRLIKRGECVKGRDKKIVRQMNARNGLKGRKGCKERKRREGEKGRNMENGKNARSVLKEKRRL